MKAAKCFAVIALMSLSTNLPALAKERDKRSKTDGEKATRKIASEAIKIGVKVAVGAKAGGPVGAAIAVTFTHSEISKEQDKVPEASTSKAPNGEKKGGSRGGTKSNSGKGSSGKRSHDADRDRRDFEHELRGMEPREVIDGRDWVDHVG